MRDTMRAITENDLERQRLWSERTFGPGDRTFGLIAHIQKELAEIQEAPTDLEEWIDVIILAIDGAWRSGWSVQDIIIAYHAKQAKNEERAWPDWRQFTHGEPIEHIKEQP